MKQKLEVEIPDGWMSIEVDVPEGWSAIAWRVPMACEWFIGPAAGLIMQAVGDVWGNRVIIVRAEKWRPATPMDLIDGPVDARWRKDLEGDWRSGRMSGYRWDASSIQFLIDEYRYVVHCEVLDE